MAISIETRVDIVQLAVAAFDAAPGAALMRELEAIVDERGGGLSAVAAALTASERWEKQFPVFQTAEEFADEWLADLLPEAEAAQMATAREFVIAHLGARGGFSDLVLAAQQFLSSPNLPAEFATVARAYINRAQVAMEHSVAQGRDGDAFGLREALAPVTSDAATVQAAIDRFGLLPSARVSGDGDGRHTIIVVGRPDPDDEFENPRQTLDASGRVVLEEHDDNGDETYDRAEAHAWSGADRVRTDFYDVWGNAYGVDDLDDLNPDRSRHFMQDNNGDGRTDDSKTETFDGDGQAVRVEYDDDSDETVDAVYLYTWTDGEITALDASGSSRGVNLDGEIAGVTGMLTVTATDFGDVVANPETAGGSKAAGTFGTGQTFNLGGGADKFAVRPTAGDEDEFDGAGAQTKSAPRLTINAGDGDDTITAPVDVYGAVAVDGGKGDDTFEFVGGDAFNESTNLAGHLVSFDGGAGDDTLLVDADAGGGPLSPRARIANVENIRLDLDDTGADGALELRLFVADGFSDAIKVTSRTAATLTAEDLGITFSVAPGADGGTVDVGNVDVSGIDAAARPSVDVEGSQGDDVLIGGAGPTTFGSRTFRGTAGGDDVVKGYSAADGDVIEITGSGVKDDSTVVMASGTDTVVTYTLVDGAGAETEHKVTVEGVNAGVKVVSETTAGEAEIAYTEPPPPDRSVGESRDVGGMLVGEGFDDDGDATLDRFETYTRDADGFVSKREVEFGDGVGDNSPDRIREDVYDKGVLTEVRHDLDADGTWDIIDTYAYQSWDTRPRSIRRVVDSNDDGAADGTTDFALYSYYGGDGLDGRVGGLGVDDAEPGGAEWLLAGPGDDIVQGHGKADWFIVDADDGEDTIVDFSPADQGDRIWIREEGVGFGDLTFTDAMRDTHHDETATDDADNTVDGVVVAWGGADRLWLPGNAKADLESDSGFFLFGDEVVVVPDSVGREYIRDASGRTTEVRYFDGWDGSADFDSLDPDRIHRYAYEGDGADWKTALINDNPTEDDVFEIQVAVARYGNGDLVSRTIEFDDGSNGGVADDGAADRIRRDTFDRDGKITEIRHDIDNDGTWDHIDAIAYESGDGLLPRARSVTRVSTMDDDDGANDATADAVRLVFGTDGHDRGAAAIAGSPGVDWFIPGRGDDVVDTLHKSASANPDGANSKDVFIFEYGDGQNLLGFYAAGAVTDTIWIREGGFDKTTDVPAADSISISMGDINDFPELRYPEETFPASGSDTVVNHHAWSADPGDQILIHSFDVPGESHWQPRFAAPETVPHDPDSFIYGSRSAAWTLDDAGRVTEIRFFDAWDGVGDPSVMDLAPDRVYRYVYDGGLIAWSTLLKNENALEDDVFEYKVTVGRDEQGRINKETILFDDGRGSGTDGDVANDGAWDRRQETAYDAGLTPPQPTSSKFDHDNDGTWDVEDAYTGAGPASGSRTLTLDNGGAADDVTVDIAFVYGTDGADTEAGAAGVQWIDLGAGDDAITGGGDADAFIFRYGDGADVITDFQTKSDTIWIRENGFDPADVEVMIVTIENGQEAMFQDIPAAAFPDNAGATHDVAVITYGGGPDDRIVLVGQSETDAAFWRGHFLTHEGHVPDLSGL